MRFGSTMIFIVALVCAGMGALLLRAALTTAPADAPADANSAGGTSVSILVAAKDLKPGDKLAATSVREAAWPSGLLPKGTFTSRAALFREGEELTLSASIAENEPILVQRLQGSQENSLAGRLHDGMRGVTIRVNDASSVGGFVQPEDRVDVLLTQTERSSEVNGGMPRAYTKTLVKNVRVLAADQQTQRKQQALPPKTVTLEVSEEDAKKLTLAGAIGQLSLTLNKGENGQEAGRTVNMRDIAALPDERKDEPATEETPVVAVFRSVDRKVYRVPQE